MFSDLKQRLAGVSWDRDGDSKIDTDDLLGAFDEDHDGVLSGSELQKLASQLAAQVEYNNVLLEELQNAEHAVMESQQDLRDHQEKLRNTMRSNEEYRNEIGELERKLYYSQQTVENGNDEHKSALLEVKRLRTELDSSHKEKEQLQLRLRQFTDEQSESMVQLNESKEQMKAALDQAELQKQEMRQQVQASQASYDAMLAQTGELRSRLAAAESTNNELREQIHLLQQKLLSHVQSLKDDNEQRDEVEKRARTAESQLTAAKQKLKGLQYVVHEQEEKMLTMQEAIAHAEATYKQLQEDLSTSQRKLNRSNAELKEMSDENHTLKMELDAVGQEMLVQARQRQEEQERLNSKIQDLRQELTRVIEEAKAGADTQTEECQNKIRSAMESRGRTEEQYVQLQNEHTKLHQMLKDVQEQNNQRLLSFEKERHELNTRAADMQRQLDHKSNELSTAQVQFGKERSEFRATYDKLKQHMSQNTERYVFLLTTFKEATRRLHKEGNKLRDTVRSTTAQFQLLHTSVGALEEKQAEPLTLWYDEMSHLLQSLSTEVKSRTAAEQTSRDQLRRVHLESEQEKSRVLMLEETVSSLQHSAALAQEKLQDEQRRTAEKLAEGKKELDIVLVQKREADASLARLQQTLDATTAQAGKLQSAYQDMQARLADNQSTSSVKINDVEGRVHELTMQVQRVTGERDGVSKKYNELRRALAETETQRQTLQGEYESARGEIARLSEQLSNSQHQSTGTLATMQGSVEGYQKQLAQTSKLLKQYSTQKQHLEGEVRFLRQQLEAAGVEIHR